MLQVAVLFNTAPILLMLRATPPLLRRSLPEVQPDNGIARRYNLVAWVCLAMSAATCAHRLA